MKSKMINSKYDALSKDQDQLDVDEDIDYQREMKNLELKNLVKEQQELEKKIAKLEKMKAKAGKKQLELIKEQQEKLVLLN